MEKEQLEKELKNIKEAIEVIAHVLENIRTWGPLGTEDKVHNILHHKE